MQTVLSYSPGGAMRAHWRHLANTIELVLPWAHPSLQPKGYLDRFNRFAGLTSVTDRQTDHATRSVSVGRICVRSTAVRPKNTEQCR